MLVPFTAFQLTNIGLTGIKKHPLEKGIRPIHLHLHNELPSQLIFAPHIDKAIFQQG